LKREGEKNERGRGGGAEGLPIELGIIDMVFNLVSNS
jgi:hypothetical protein